MLRFTILLVFLYVLLAISETVSKPACGPVCDIFCSYGNVPDENGCPTCKCKPSPCENGLALMAGYFCGLGLNRKDCPAAYECVIAPNDAYAVCCPRHRWIIGNI